MNINDYVVKVQSTFRFDIFMAGDITQAKQVIREYCEVGLCVTIEPLDFIYTGGEESGFKVGLLCYPRFPQSSNELFEHAQKLGNMLRERLFQNSFLIVGREHTHWYSRPLLDKQKENK